MGAERFRSVEYDMIDIIEDLIRKRSGNGGDNTSAGASLMANMDKKITSEAEETGSCGREVAEVEACDRPQDSGSSGERKRKRDINNQGDVENRKRKQTQGEQLQLLGYRQTGIYSI